MPDPQDVLDNTKEKKINNLNIDNNISNPPESKTQIKNISQELERPKTNLDENKITSKINNLNDLIKLAETEKEIELKFDLERNVRLVKFSNGKIDIAFNEKLAKDFIKNLTSKLLEWTGRRWIITLSKNEGDKTIYERQDEENKKVLELAKKTEIYKKVKEIFPDAELTNVDKVKNFNTEE
jgi:DNA polymerase-3 subunit gamma/tau